MTVILTRKNRKTGADITLIDNRQGDFDTDDYQWITLCETHGNYCSHETRALAEAWVSAPDEWCGDCELLINPLLRESIEQMKRGELTDA